MKKDMVNSTHIEGLLYQHSLELKVAGTNSKNPGVEYITGTVDIATDHDLVNIVPVHFTYVTPTTKKNTANNTFVILKGIIDRLYKSCMADGEEFATKFRIDSKIDLNEFPSDRSGKMEIVSTQRNEGGFIHVVSALAEDESTRNTFDVDVLIEGTQHIEADAEKGMIEKVVLKGNLFNYRGEILPVKFSVTDPAGMNYFEGLEPTKRNPVFTRIKGNQISESVIKKVVEESAFGGPSVKEYKNTRKDFVVTWAKPEPYEWDSEATITAKEVADALANREVHLADLMSRNSKAPEAPKSKGDTFNF